MTTVKTASVQDTAVWLEQDTALLIDVREADEHAKESINGALLISLSVFDASALPQGKRIVVHCLGGKRGAQAASQLVQLGFEDVHNLEGGLMGWKKAGLATVV
jgi:rhodanese-related sulfurtransferase